MAGNIKGITISFRGDTTELSKALRQVDKETASIDSELRKVNGALKFNPTSVDLWRQKQTLLSQKISETSERLKTLKAAQKELDNKHVDKNSKEYRNLQREIITTESKLKNFKNQLKQVGNVNLRATSEQFKQIGSKATAAGNAMRGISRAAGVLVASIGALTYKSAQWADNLNTLQKKYRISTKDLQMYAAASKLVDVDVNTVTRAHVKLNRTMGSALKGSKTAVETFEKLGIAIQDENGALRDNDEVFQAAIQALGQMENETERDALAMDLFGKAATELNPLIEDGGETYKNFAETLKKYDLDFVDQETLDKANEFNDKIDTIKSIGLLAFQSIGAQLAEVFEPILEKVVEKVGEFAKWFSNLNPVVIAVVAGIAALVAAIAPALLIFGALSSAVGVLLGALAGISAPVIAVGAAIAAFVALFATALAKSQQFRDAVSQLAEVLVSTFEPVIEAAITMVKEFVTEIIDTAKAIADELAPVITALMPILKLVASFMAGRLKSAFTLVTGVIKVLGAAIRAMATIFKGTALAIITIASGIYSKLKSTFGKVREALVHPFESAKETIKGFIDKIKSYFPINIGNILSNVKLPHFSLKWGEKDFGPLGKIKYPTGFNPIKWYARGGIFNSPTLAGIGEAGPEAVVPLSGHQMEPFARAIAESMNGFNYEKLTAAIVAALMSVNSDIVLDIDGKRVADVTAPYMNTAINTLQRRQDRKIGIVGV